MTNTSEVAAQAVIGDQTIEDRVAALFDTFLSDRAAPGTAQGDPAHASVPVSVPVSDDFFERGGNSMLAARLVAKLRKEFDVSVSIRDVFRGRTVAAVSQAIRERLGAGQ